MIRQPDFTGARIKVERAYEHFGDLTARYESFRNVKPYKTFSYDEPDTGDLVYKVTVSGQPPLRWSAIAGDCVHNLRSSLDLLVCEMVRAEGNEVKDSTGFPVFRSKSAFTNAFEPGPPGQIKGAPQSAVDLIKRAKPYKGANNAFWLLHQLDIADKHKLLVPVGTVHEANVFNVDLASPELTNRWISAQALVGTKPAEIVTPDQPFPLKDGAEIYRVPTHIRSDPKAQMYVYPQFQFEVAFGEVEVVEGEALIPTLHQLIQFVEEFVELFPLLFSQTDTP